MGSWWGAPGSGGSQGVGWCRAGSGTPWPGLSRVLRVAFPWRCFVHVDRTCCLGASCRVTGAVPCMCPPSSAWGCRAGGGSRWELPGRRRLSAAEWSAPKMASAQSGALCLAQQRAACQALPAENSLPAGRKGAAGTPWRHTGSLWQGWPGLCPVRQAGTRRPGLVPLPLSLSGAGAVSPGLKNIRMAGLGQTKGLSSQA